MCVELEKVLHHSLFCTGVRGTPECTHTVAEGAMDPLAWCLVAVLLVILEKEGVKTVTLDVSCFLLGAHRSSWLSL